MAESYEEMIRKVLPRFRKPVEVDQVALAEAMRRGARAKQLLDDEDLKQAFTMVEAVYMHVWKTTDAMDVERRERCHDIVTALGDVKKYLISCVETGDAARGKLESAALQF